MMKLLVPIMTLALAGCSSMNIKTEKAEGADLARYKTYKWAVKAGEPLLRKDLEEVIGAELRRADLKETDSQTPDFFVTFEVLKSNKQVVTNWAGTGYSAHRGPAGMYGSRYGTLHTGPTVTNYIEGTLILEFIDGRSRDTFWRGVASDVLRDESPNKRKVADAAKALLEKYREGG